MGIGTLGFLKGASGTMLSSIDAREEVENEIKKQKRLEELRADIRLQEEMAKATSFQIEKDPGSGKMKTVGFNSQGQRIESTVRDATESEIAGKLQEEEDRKYTLEERGRKVRRDDQIYTQAERDQQMQEERLKLERLQTQASVAASNRSGRSLDGSGSGKKANLSEVMDSIMSRNSKAIQELSGQEGVPLSTIQSGAWKFAELRIAKGDSPLELERNFSNYLTELRREAQKRGSRLGRYKKKVGDSDTTGW